MSHHKYKLAMLNRLQELGLRLETIDGALEAQHSKDWEEAAIEREDDEVLERLGLDGQAEVARIRNALDRLAKGEYGYCVNCGEEISEKRLDILPDAPNCVKCAGS